MKSSLFQYGKLRYVTVISLWQIIFLSAESFAQKWSAYNTPHGLAGQAVKAILVDRQGEIWFATNNGVSRFNGAWESYGSQDGLVHDFVATAVQDEEGHIWLGTNDLTKVRPIKGGVSKIDPASDLRDSTNWHNYTVANTDSGLSSNQVTSILFDAEGKIWVGTFGGGISVADPTPVLNDPSQDPLRHRKNWRTFTSKDGLSSDEVRDVEMDGAGNVWVVTSVAVNIYERATRQWQTFSLQSKLADESARVIFRDQKENMWIGTVGFGVYHVAPKNLLAYDRNYTTMNSGLAHDDVIAIAQDREGATWFGHSREGVSMAAADDGLENKRYWRHFTVSDGLSANETTSIAEDVEGNVWFGHLEKGVSQLNRTWSTFLAQPELQTNFVNGLFEVERRFLWIATEGGAVQFDLEANLTLSKNQNHVLIKSKSGLSANRVFAVFQDSRSFLWFGTIAGANRVAADAVDDSSRWLPPFNAGNGLIWDEVNWITEDPSEHLWFATNRGVSRVHVDSTAFVERWMKITTSSGLVANTVNVIHRDRNGNLWFATDNGISFLNPALNPKDSTNWANYTTKNGLVDDRVRSIYEDANGNLWFATQGGASQVNPQADLRIRSNWKSYTTADGLASNFVAAIIQFRPDEFWFGTAVGASKFEMRANKWTTYTTSAGLLNNFIQALFTDGKEIWFGTAGGGATRYRPKTMPPQTYLTRDFDVVTANRLTFKYRGADIITPTHELRYQYHLDDEDWRETSDQSATVLVRDSDKPQRHVFEVMAIDRDGNVDPTPARDVFYKMNAQLGGEVTIMDEQKNVRLYLPPGVLVGDTSITVTPARNADLRDTLAIVGYDILPKSLKLKKPATLAITLANAKDYNPGQLAIFRQDSLDWSRVGGTVTTAGGRATITTAITALGRYAVRNARISHLDGAIAEVNIQPRVFSPTGGGRGHGERANISFALKDAALVSVKIYDLAGRLKKIVQENLSLQAGVNVVDWDGRDETGNFCVSGLYVVAIEAEGKVQTKTVMIANKYK